MGHYYLYPQTYTKYISKPIYRFSRKYLSKSKDLAMHAAVLPGSLAFAGLVYYYNDPDPLIAIIAFLLHQVFIHEGALYAHNRNVKERLQKAPPLENIVKT